MILHEASDGLSVFPVFSPSVHCLRQSRASGCRLSRFAQASVSGVRPVHCASLRLRGLAGPACWHSLLIMLAVTESQSRGGAEIHSQARASAGQPSDVVTLCLLSSWP